MAKLTKLEKLIANEPILQNVPLGVSVGDGWVLLLEKMCLYINEHIQTAQVEPPVGFKFNQIKEKFGALRIDCAGDDAYIQGIVAMIEAFSTQICEMCGNCGKVQAGDWLKTLCTPCNNKTKKL